MLLPVQLSRARFRSSSILHIPFSITRPSSITTTSSIFLLVFILLYRVALDEQSYSHRLSYHLAVVCFLLCLPRASSRAALFKISNLADNLVATI